MLTKSGVELADDIREGRTTSTAVVEAHIEQIKRVNPVVNAVVRERFDEALVEAKQADALIGSVPADELPPFHGVPCTIKEAFALTGMPNSAGLVSREDVIAKEDAPTVARLREAGAIPLGVTNVSELCMWMESTNRVYGRTNNPYDPRRTSGGSSGGEGAIVSAGGSPFGLGSDIGGSIRMPAFFNGIFGHKPSSGIIPNVGQFPIAENEALRYLTTGPLARRAEDLWPLVEILAGPDGTDDVCKRVDLGHPRNVDVSGLEVVSVPANGLTRVSKTLQDAQMRAANALVDLGCKVKWCNVDKLKRSLDIWSSMMSAAGGSTYAEILSPDKGVRLLPELARWATGRSPFTLPSIALVGLERLPKAFPTRTKRFVALGAELKAELEDLIGDGVMLFPSHPYVAPRHVLPLAPPINWIYTGIFNVTELPATQVPLGLNDKGLPLGVQVVGSWGNDRATVAVALELERIFGGWVPPKLVRGGARVTPSS